MKWMDDAHRIQDTDKGTEGNTTLPFSPRPPIGDPIGRSLGREWIAAAAVADQHGPRRFPSHDHGHDHAMVRSSSGNAVNNRVVARCQVVACLSSIRFAL